MKKLVLGLTVALATLCAAPASQSEAEKRLEAAAYKENVQGDLKGAIELYRKVAVQFATNRPVAVKALLRMAECYQKLGDAESRKIYERVVRDYADQKDAVALARAALGGGAQPGQQAARLVLESKYQFNNEIRGYYNAHVSFSPDGRSLSYVDWDNGNLMLHDMARGSDRRLTDQGNWAPSIWAHAEESAISRDGKQVAYAWAGRNWELRIQLLQSSGSPAPRQLLVNEGNTWIGPVDWSPDGSWLAVNLERKDGSLQIGRVSTLDGSLRVLKSDGFLGGLSPDGNYIVYTRRTRGVSRGYIMPVNGTSEVPLVSEPSSVESPVWTPDGARIVFVSDRTGSPGLWSARVANGKPLSEPELLKRDFRDAFPVHVARDGSIFYTIFTTQSNIYVAALDSVSGKLTSEPKRVNQRSIDNSFGPVAWLPDGKSLSFWNRRSGSQALVVHTLASGEERDVSVHGVAGGQVGCIGWFPDGHSYMSWQVKGQTWVFSRVDSQTGEVQATWTVAEAAPMRTFAGAPLTSDFAFSPDLMTVFFPRWDRTVPCERGQCMYAMVARDLQTGRDREIYRTKARVLDGTAISPDGRNLAVVVVPELNNGEGLLMIVPVSGGAPREAYHKVADIGRPPQVWTRDGMHVLAFHMDRGVFSSFPVSGGAPEESPLPARMKGRLGLGQMSPAVSPAGSQIAFVGKQHIGQLWALSGLLPDSKKVVPR